MGNPTCDLDSAVSALAHGFLEYHEAKSRSDTDLAVIPLMNIPRKEFRLKTEVVYYLKRHGILPDLLTFRDDVDLVSLGDRLQLILVDHHVLPDEDVSLKDRVVRVIDHRPQDESWPWLGKTIHLRLVGSCATLVAENILRRHPEILDATIASLLRGPILVDTSNFSSEADRATPTDVEVIDALEKVGNLSIGRDDDFKEILAAKTDVSQLTAEDLLVKDLKVVNGVPMAGLPMLVEKFLGMEGSLEALLSFVKSRGCSMALVMGLDLKNDRVTRDIAVFSLSSNDLENEIIRALTSSAQPSLDLTLAKRVEEEGYKLLHYRQGNLRATRKQVLPIVQLAVIDARRR